MEQIVGESQLVVKPDRRALSRYGLAVGDVMELVSEGLGGASAGQIINGNERYDIYVRLDERFRQDRESIADLRLQAPSGAWVRLGDVAEVTIASGPPQVRRDDVQRRVVVQANVQGRDMGSVVDRIAAVFRLPFRRPGAADPDQPAAGDDRRHRRPVPVRAVPVGAQLHRLHHPVRGGRAQRRSAGGGHQPAYRIG
jgi:hypothetical protein